MKYLRKSILIGEGKIKLRYDLLSNFSVCRGDEESNRSCVLDQKLNLDRPPWTCLIVLLILRIFIYDSLPPIYDASILGVFLG